MTAGGIGHVADRTKNAEAMITGMTEYGTVSSRAHCGRGPSRKLEFPRGRVEKGQPSRSSLPAATSSGDCERTGPSVSHLGKVQERVDQHIWIFNHPTFSNVSTQNERVARLETCASAPGRLDHFLVDEKTWTFNG